MRVQAISCGSRSISVSQQVGVSVSCLSSPSRLSSFKPFPVCQAKYACHVGTQPWDTHQLFFVSVSPLTMFPFFFISPKPPSPFTGPPSGCSEAACEPVASPLLSSLPRDLLGFPWVTLGVPPPFPCQLVVGALVAPCTDCQSSVEWNLLFATYW